MTIRELLYIPTTIDDVHESVYRSYHVLKHVKTMVERGDSAATVCEVIDLLTHENKKEYRVTSVKNENSHQAIKEENPVE